MSAAPGEGRDAVPESQAAHRLGADVQAVETRLAALLEQSPAPATRLDRAVAHSLLDGGKRLRPVLCLWVFDAVTAPRTPAVWSAALALELIHTYSLIHDDLPAMDDDDLRRGKPSCHRAFDEATAILAGDVLQAEAFGLLAGVEPPALAVRLGLLLAQAAGRGGMVAGQQLDLEASGNAGPGLDVETLHRLKTGRLLGAAAAMGATCAGCPQEVVGQAREAGERLGIAFQIVDDVLDEEAPAARLGKTSGKDRAQGKLTAISALGPQAARQRARALGEEARGLLEASGLWSSCLDWLLGQLIRRDR